MPALLDEQSNVLPLTASCLSLVLNSDWACEKGASDLGLGSSFHL